MRLVGSTFIILFFLVCSKSGSGSEEEKKSTCAVVLRGGTTNCLLSLSATVTTNAGPSQGTTTSGDTDNIGSSARFFGPSGMTTDGTNLFVGDFGNNKIRKIVINTGAVSTLAGPAEGCSGSCPTGDTDGTGVAARFNGPYGLTTDGTNLYVADYANNKIRKVVISTGVVSTFAGPAAGATTNGDTDGIGNAARFRSPTGITTDGTNLYVADSNNNKVRKIVIATADVTTLAGPAPGAITSGDTDAAGNSARFSGPYGITTDGTNLYVADHSNNKIRKVVISSGLVSTFAGPSQGSNTAGDSDGLGNAARFFQPRGMTTDGTNLYVADVGFSKIRKIALSTATVTTLAGQAPGSSTSGDTDAIGNAALFANPRDITTNGTSLFVADTNNNKIRKIN